MQPWPGVYHHPQDHKALLGQRQEDGGCRGACKDLCFVHPSEEHHSVPEQTGGELLHSSMQKTIHKIRLPAAVRNHCVTPPVAPKPTPAQPSRCPGSLQTTHQARRDVPAKQHRSHPARNLPHHKSIYPLPSTSHGQLCRGAVLSPHVTCAQIPALSVQFTSRTKQNTPGGC